MNPDLHRFVRDALARGIPRAQIREALVRARWPEDEIVGALDAWQDDGLGVPVPRRRVQLSAREAFLYLVMFATLYVVAYHTGAILFALVERGFPDPATYDSAWDRLRQTVRFGAASLIVAFPVFLWTSRILGSAMALDPEKRRSGVRRWLTYLTLFNAACVLIGDFIVVVLGMLNGELTARFLLKALVVAAIAGALFVHYLGGLRRDEGDVPATASPARAWLPRLSGLVVLAVIVLALVLAGSPTRVRHQMLDQRRLQDVQQLSREMTNYHDRFGSFPTRLGELSATGFDGSGSSLRDPVTKGFYDYRLVDSLAFELCATFDAPDSVGPHGTRADEFWQHGAGHTCFTFRVPPKK